MGEAHIANDLKFGLNPEEIVNATMGQAANGACFVKKRGRLTSSRFKGFLHGTKPMSHVKAVLYPSVSASSVALTDEGHHEADAVVDY